MSSISFELNELLNIVLLCSIAELTPISLVRTPDSPAFPQTPSLRDRVEQRVDAIAGSRTK
jgi:hypothetical protein